jgi:DNA invertase Pin-like site-specific DNA recombinase
MGAGLRIGYVRVSTADQNTARQLDGIELDKVFTDHASGRDANRTGLVEVLGYVRDGDELVTHSMDRLARNVDDLRRIVSELTLRGVRVRFVKEGLTFTGDDNAMSRLLLTMLGAVAEFERALIRERQREGIAIAKAKGVYKGRKPALDATQAARLVARIQSGEAIAALAREFGISRETVYQYKRSALAADCL